MIFVEAVFFLCCLADSHRVLEVFELAKRVSFPVDSNISLPSFSAWHPGQPHYSACVEGAPLCVSKIYFVGYVSQIFKTVVSVIAINVIDDKPREFSRLHQPNYVVGLPVSPHKMDAPSIFAVGARLLTRFYSITVNFFPKKFSSFSLIPKMFKDIFSCHGGMLWR